MNISIQTLDIIALGFFFLSWIGYSKYAQVKAKSSCSLLGVMPRYRTIWMQNMQKRDERLIDAIIVGHLMRMISFFASTTILIIAVIFAGLGSVEKINDLAMNLPFVTDKSVVIQGLRMVVLLLIFIYAFFKFTWALRQNNFVLILIGGATENPDEKIMQDIVDKTSKLESLAANSFNHGLRAYYFALAVLPWFLHPLLFMLATVIIVFVLNRREFQSETLNILSPEKDIAD